MKDRHGLLMTSKNDIPELLINSPQRAKHAIILAHGAGAAMDTPFMTTFSEGLAVAGLQVIRLEFPYMANVANRANVYRPTVSLCCAKLGTR